MVNKIISFSLNNRLIIGLLTLALMLWGIYNYTILPIDAVPDITNTQVQVITVSPSLAPQENGRVVQHDPARHIADERRRCLILVRRVVEVDVG